MTSVKLKPGVWRRKFEGLGNLTKSKTVLFAKGHGALFASQSLGMKITPSSSLTPTSENVDSCARLQLPLLRATWLREPEWLSIAATAITWTGGGTGVGARE